MIKPHTIYNKHAVAFSVNPIYIIAIQPSSTLFPYTTLFRSRECMRGPRRRDRRQHRDAERTADLLRRVEQTGRKPSLGGPDAGEGSDRDRHEREAEAEAHEQEARQQAAEIRAGDGDLGAAREPAWQ